MDGSRMKMMSGPSMKYITLEGVREVVTVCDRGGGSKSM